MSPGGSVGKESACSAGNLGSWVGKIPLKEGIATHSSILAWRIPWTEGPGGLQSMGLQRVRYDWVTNTHTHTHTHFNNYMWLLSQKLLYISLSSLKLNRSALTFGINYNFSTDTHCVVIAGWLMYNIWASGWISLFKPVFFRFGLNFILISL